MKTDFGVKRYFHDACALQMNRKRSDEQKRVLAEALEKKRRTVRRPHQLQLQPTLVRTRRQRAVSAAVVAPPPHRCSRDGHCSCPRCSGRRDGDWWKSCHSTSTSPTRREATRTRRSSLPPDSDVCTDSHGKHARTTCRLRCGAGCFGGFGCTDRALHVGLAGPAAACLRLHTPVARARSTGLRTRYGCSPAMPNWLRMPAMLKALRRKTTVTCR